MSLRIKFIQFLLHTNERLIFYPRLAKFYKSAINTSRPVILDVGANKGQTIRFFLKLFPQAVIYAFEPNHKLFNRLVAEFRNYSNVHLVNKGISNKTGKLLLKETVTDETSTFEELNYESAYLKMKSKVLGVKLEAVVKDIFEVEVTTLNAFISEMKLTQIHVLKIDTEGHEMKCLEGLFSGQIHPVDYMQLEHHYDDMYQNAVKEGEMAALLQNYGYRLHKVIKHGFGDFHELIFSTAIS